MSISKQERAELRAPVFFDVNKQPFSIKNFEKIEFDKPHTVSIYIGNDNGILPHGFGLRIRFYENDQLKNLTLLDKEHGCFFEIKIPGGSDGTRRKKIRVQTTFGEILDNLTNYDIFAKWLHNHNVTLGHEISLEIKQLFEGAKQGLTPLFGMSYKRIHFQQPNKRITVDSDVRNFQVLKVQNDYMCILGEEFSPKILEIKDENPIDENEAQLLADGSPQKISDFSKFDLAEKINNKHSFKKRNLIFLDWMSNNSENLFWKIKVASNPLVVLEQLSLSQNYFVLDPNRYELGPSKRQKLGMQSQELNLIDNSFVHFQQGEKLERLLFDKKTNSLFKITAIHMDLSDKSEINQFQVTDIGEISNKNDEAVTNNVSFDEVNLAIFNYIKMNELHPQIVRGKISSIKLVKDNNHDNVPKSTHAEIDYEILNGSEIVGKTYDTANSKLSLSEIIKLFVEYRNHVKAIYEVPELHAVEKLSKSAFKSKEQKIKGKSLSEIIKNGNKIEIAQIFARVLIPLAKTINSPINLPDGSFSPYPVSIPIDLKPDNFILSSDDKLYFVDFFTPWKRKKDGSLLQIFREQSSKNLVFGDFHVMVTKFLLWCLKENPKEGYFMFESICAILDEVDPSLLLTKIFKTNLSSQKVKTDFLKIEGGKDVIELAEHGNKVNLREQKYRVLTLNDVVDDENSAGSAKKNLIVPGGDDNFFVFRGYEREYGDSKVIRFVPFFRDDTELFSFGSVEIAKIIFSLDNQPTNIILPHKGSSAYPILSTAVSIYEQYMSSQNKSNVAINRINLDSNDSTSHVSWPTRITFKPNVLGLSKGDVEKILQAVEDGQSICILDDIRRSGRTETTIIKLLSMIIDGKQLVQMMNNGKLKFVYLCSEYNPNDKQPMEKLGNHTKAVYFIPYIQL